jgi:hypothetical protein
VAETVWPVVNWTGDLLAAVDLSRDVRLAIDELLESKLTTPELGRGPRISVVDTWAEAVIAAHAPDRLELTDSTSAGTREEADLLFRRLIGAD